MATKKLTLADSIRVEDRIAFIRAWNNQDFGVGVLKALMGKNKEDFITHVKSIVEYIFPGQTMSGAVVEINQAQKVEFFKGYYEDAEGSRKKVTVKEFERIFGSFDWNAYGYVGTSYRQVVMDNIFTANGGDKVALVDDEKNVLYIHVSWTSEGSAAEALSNDEVCYKLFVKHATQAIEDIGNKSPMRAERRFFLPLSYHQYGVEHLARLVKHHNKAVVKVVPDMMRVSFDVEYFEDGFGSGPIGWPMITIRSAQARDSHNSELGL